MPQGAVAPLLVVAVVIALDCWVYVDAKQRDEQGRPVIFRAGALVIDTPLAWLVGCLLLCILFLPLYASSRKEQSP